MGFSVLVVCAVVRLRYRLLGVELLQDLTKQDSQKFIYVMRNYVVYVRGVIWWFQVYCINVTSCPGLRTESSNPLVKRYRGVELLLRLQRQRSVRG